MSLPSIHDPRDPANLADYGLATLVCEKCKKEITGWWVRYSEEPEKFYHRDCDPRHFGTKK